MTTTDPNPYAVTFTIDVDKLALDTEYQRFARYNHDGEPEEDWAPTGKVTLMDLVLREAVRQVVSQITEKQREEIRAEAAKIITAEAQRQVVELVGAALAEDVRPTDSFGYARGEARPLGAMIVEQAKTWLTESDRYDQESSLKKLVKTQVAVKLESELGETIKDEKAKVRAAVRAVAAEKLGDILNEALGRVR